MNIDQLNKIRNKLLTTKQSYINAYHSGKYNFEVLKVIEQEFIKTHFKIKRINRRIVLLQEALE